MATVLSTHEDFASSIFFEFDKTKSAKATFLFTEWFIFKHDRLAGKQIIPLRLYGWIFLNWTDGHKLDLKEALEVFMYLGRIFNVCTTCEQILDDISRMIRTVYSILKHIILDLSLVFFWQKIESNLSFVHRLVPWSMKFHTGIILKTHTPSFKKLNGWKLNLHSAFVLTS